MSEGRTVADVTLLMGPGIALKDVEAALKKHFRSVSPVFPVSNTGRIVFEMGGYNEEKLPGDVYIEKNREVNNSTRADWADAGVKAFQNVCATDDEDVLCDLLCDLMHWADKNNYDFEAAMFRAKDHYDEEIKEDIEQKAAEAVSDKQSFRDAHGVGRGGKKRKAGPSNAGRRRKNSKRKL